ncbi:MAG TPA: MarR family winged helix-turn-helix transcriptional regulator [Azospirillum sp.]|nr:MarR family winged helix-turn-helix transcriptional regulator [Azospirillum sp.]
MHGPFKRYGAALALAPSSNEIAAESIEANLSHVVRDVHRSFSRALQMRIASYGVSMGQWFFLRALWEEDGLTQRELSQRVGMMEPTTVTALNTMEHKGLVERVRNPHDRRKVNIFLTVHGRALKTVLLDCASGVNEMAVRGIAPDDVRRAMEVLCSISSNLGSLDALHEDLD